MNDHVNGTMAGILNTFMPKQTAASSCTSPSRCCAHVWKYEPSTLGNYRRRHCDKCGQIEYNGRDGEWLPERHGHNSD